MYLLFDIGGTHIRAAVSDGENIVKKKVIDTPSDYENAMQELSWLGNEELGGNHTQVVCGIAGVLQANKQSLFSSPNLPNWVGKPLKEDMERLFSTPVHLENDAALAGLGEAHFGSGKDAKIMMYYTIGTGIGGTRIVNGKIDAHVYGMEPGQQIIDSIHVTLEDLAGGNSIEERTHMEPSEIKDERVWNHVTESLSLGLYNSILHWSPEVVVLGGGLINENVINIEKIKEYL